MGGSHNQAVVTYFLVAEAKRMYTTPGHGAGLAQLVEHLICNQGVRGSSPLAGTTFIHIITMIYRKYD
tara:strand:- start:3134 stop:3337 length:204 start_codon:yes stop_codon:yes gene_type:complete